jgi:Zn-dependent M16 (insulinase) family peptidase
VLPLSAVEKKTESIESEKRYVGGVEVLFVPAPTNGIGYLSMAFDASLLSPEDAVWLSLFSSVFTSMGTTSMDYVRLTQELGIRTGGVGASLSAMGRMGTSGDVNPVFAVGCKCLGEKSSVALSLLGDLCVTQNFSDESRLKDLLGAEYAGVTSFVMENGARLAMLRAFATVSQRGRYAEMAQGIDYVRFVKSLVESGEAGVRNASVELARVASLVLCRKALGVVAFSGSAIEWKLFEENFGVFLNRLHTAPTTSFSFSSPHLSPRNTAMVVPSQVQYVGLSHTASGDVGLRARIDFLGHVLRSGYLWDEVRVKGGAYGCMVSYGVESGELAMVSYRDPNLKRTLDVYRGIASYVQGLPLTQEALDTLKIGYMGGVDRPKTFAQKNREVWRRKLVGVSQSEMQIMRDAVLSATIEDMRALSVVLEPFASGGSISVVGSASAVEKDRELFGSVEEVRM